MKPSDVMTEQPLAVGDRVRVLTVLDHDRIGALVQEWRVGSGYWKISLEPGHYIWLHSGEFRRLSAIELLGEVVP